MICLKVLPMMSDSNLDRLKCTSSMSNTETMQTLNQDDIRALLDLIEFHDDWDACSEQLGVDVAALYDKVSALLN